MSEGLGDGLMEPDFGATGVIDGGLLEPDWNGGDKLLEPDWNSGDGLLEPDFADIHRDDLLNPFDEMRSDDLPAPDFLDTHGDDLLTPDFE